MATIELYADDWAFSGDKYEQIREQYIEDYGEEPTYKQMYEYVRFEYEYLMNELKGLFNQGHVYVLSGSFGRWNGPVYGGNILECIEDLQKVLSFNAEHYDTFKDENGEFTVTQSHHDGCNHYTIRELTKKGLTRYMNHKAQYGGVDEELFNSLIHTREYTRKANIPKALGWRF